MLHKVKRSRAKKQELPCPIPGLPALINNSAQFRKQVWRTVYFVDDCECARLCLQECPCVFELAQICASLQIKVQ